MRVTELPNPLTHDIDELPASGILDRLAAADEQIFGSPEWGLGLYDSAFLKKLGQARARLQEVLRHPDGGVILSGAGTSGRLAVHAASNWGEIHGPERVLALMAGGPLALFRAREGIEDRPECGAADLAAVLPRRAPFALIGISCGLSAAYVAGQVALALERGAAAVIVIGFNPLEAASQRPLPSLGRSMRELLAQLGRSENGFLLNPVIGPEPIAGSTRMKGGSATKIMLDMLLSQEDPPILLRCYHRLLDVFRTQARPLAAHVERATNALLGGAGLIYAADAASGMPAIMDASECPPTFGAEPDQVRALVTDDFNLPLPGLDFGDHRLAGLNPDPAAGHMVLFIGERVLSPQQALLRQNLEAKGADCLAVFPREYLAKLPLPSPTAARGLVDLFAKWYLNAISTGAFIGYGKVHGNRMIDLRISNLKLWERARGLVASLGDVSEQRAEMLLRRTIGMDDPESKERPESLVSRAAQLPRVVPTTILMARRGMTAAEARARLQRVPKLKNCL